MTPFEPAGAEAPGSALEWAVRALTTPPPELQLEQAICAARRHYGWTASGSALSGERDRNYLLKVDGKGPVTLKYVNAAEMLGETDLQVQVLRHLESVGCAVSTPRAILTSDGAPWFLEDTPAGPVRGRVYSYLSGLSAAQAPGTAELRRGVGRVVAELDEALQCFEHPAVDRMFLWDVMHVTQLLPLARSLQRDETHDFITDFLEHYGEVVAPRLDKLPQQVIHGDLSKSNLLVDTAHPDRVVGVLDFGDVVRAPAVADLSIAASYHMNDSNDPVAALDDVIAGHESVRPLKPAERDVLLDLVIARLVQRIVITQWRAIRFPANSEYILRSNPDARRLLQALAPIWKSERARTSN